ncbi:MULTISPECIES: FimV/HubP family polar landmark protein [Pseudomonas]|uniref:Peptidoglycan-binding protein n=1 Tax=Pseudomonas parafulva TaxID=157782 RepID=A0ABM6J0Z0_9PSED|nr:MULTISPECIES: FimV/HubP family polar landmark protein [Pseudomonas]AQW67929.1 peptidoglycan-binding protein [Pseudomonas parafulva]MBF8681118.1 FimV family protein [Pseudomonas fulva]MBF8719869.1 FimV family protein [Pseudomonas fulva]MBF8784910.1 FimV family protein [Pseudomonas fulva]WHU40494.1 FimV/HubP family polar landmark protein [Pseudomonas fulva]
MLRIRKLVLAMAAASALSSGMANALGLGELTLKSAQNQPLEAEIELLDVRDLTAAQLAPSLAPPEEFAKAGVNFSSALQDLRFTPVINPNGRSVLRVTSSQPMPGPVVKFLVQVMWPQGRLLRDYNVLLDQAKAQGPEAATGNVAAATTGPGSYTTQRRDTLWQIAARNAQGGSIQQTMIAIQALNPDAFIGNNINQLKVGQVLRLPDQQQIQSIAQGEANREVAEQYAAWREGRRLGPRARQLDATRRGAADAAPAAIAQGDNLRLVSPGNQPGAGQAKALNDKLAVAQESLDTSRRENEELKSRMSDLQSQLDKLQRLIELKNDQLARLEAQGAATPAPTATVPGEPGQQAPAPSQAAVPVTDPVPTASQPTVPDQPVIAPAPSVAPDAQPAAQTSSDSTLDDVLGSRWLLWLIAGSTVLVLALLLWLLARKRRAQQEAEKHLRMARALEEEQIEGFDPEDDSLDGVEVVSPTVTLSPAAVAASAAAAAASEKPAAQPVREPAADPYGPLLAQADTCIAEGRLNRATELLEPAVASAPRRDDLRLKLMEVYARQGDQSAFAEQERQLPATAGNTAEVASLRERYPAMLALAAAGVGAAALAAKLDEQYVQGLLDDQPGSPHAEPAESDTQAAAGPDAFNDIPTLDTAALDDQALEDNFDLSLDDPSPEPATSAADPADEALSAGGQMQDPADADFETLLAQASAEAQPAQDLSDFDLDIGEPEGAGGRDDAAPSTVDPVPAFDPATDFDLPADFDLSLQDDSPGAQQFASELDDVNAELDKLSQSLESPSLEPHFTAEDAAAQPELEPIDDLDFDFFSGADEVATKLDLARAYIDMGDHQGARDILDEVVKDGDERQREEAEDMLSRLV